MMIKELFYMTRFILWPTDTTKLSKLKDLTKIYITKLIILFQKSINKRSDINWNNPGRCIKYQTTNYFLNIINLIDLILYIICKSKHYLYNIYFFFFISNTAIFLHYYMFHVIFKHIKLLL